MVAPELYAGMEKMLIDLKQKWKGPFLWFNNKTRSSAALVWTLLLWIYWCRCTLKVWDFFFVLTDRMTSSAFRKIKGLFCPSEADAQHVLCRYASDRILTTKYRQVFIFTLHLTKVCSLQYMIKISTPSAAGKHSVQPLHSLPLKGCWCFGIEDNEKLHYK